MNISDFLTVSSIFFLAKLGLLFFLFIYLIFAAIVMRQTKVMTETLQVGFETPIRTISFIHFLFALFVFLLAIFIL